MYARAKEGACLGTLVKMAKPLCQEAERQCPRTGPGRPPEFPDWLMATLIMTAILKKKKSKSAQYRFLEGVQAQLKAWLDLKRFPSRATYFVRYRKAQRLFQAAIQAQARRAVAERVVEPTTVAVDKSLISARGPLWHKRDRVANRIPKGLHGVDRDGTWAHSDHDGWVQGYSYEVVVSAPRRGTVFPLLASADTASTSEHTSFGSKVDQLHPRTKYLLGDKAYDNDQHARSFEDDPRRARRGRHFITPAQPRNTANRQGTSKTDTHWGQQPHAIRRRRRIAFFESRRGRGLYVRRRQTVEPFNDWFKTLFELDQQVWHRGLDNNRTQILAGIFGYQLLVRYNHRCGHKNGQIKWILDRL